MDLLIKYIALPYLESLTLLFGVLGFLVSLILIFSLDLMKITNNFFNQQIEVDNKLKCLNRHIQTDLFYRHPILTGSMLVTGSLIVLSFLCFRLDILLLIQKLHIHKNWELLVVCFFYSMALFSKLTSAIGILAGLLMIFYPSGFKKIENKMNYWILTQPLEDKLNELHKDTDTICFLHSFFIGILGIISSSFLVVLSISNLLHY